MKLFTGEIPPYTKKIRDSRRMFLDEMKKKEQEEITNFVSENKILIISDILKGRDKLSANWILVILKRNNNSYEIIEDNFK